MVQFKRKAKPLHQTKIGFIVVEKRMMYFFHWGKLCKLHMHIWWRVQTWPPFTFSGVLWLITKPELTTSTLIRSFHIWAGYLFFLPGFCCCLQHRVENGNNRQQQESGRRKVFHQTSVISSSTSSPSASPSASPSSSSSSSDVTSSSSVWETHFTQEHTNR